MNNRYLIAALILFCSYSTNGKTQPSEDILYLGIIENLGYRVDEDSMEFKQTLRPLFYFRDSVWESLQDSIGTSLYPQKNRWFIAYDGRYFGSFTSTKAQIEHPDNEWTYPRDVYHSVGEQKLPVFGKANYDYMGFPFRISTRPLVAVTDSNYHDPEGWHVSYPPANKTKGMRLLYREYVNEFENHQVDSLKNITVLKAYENNTGDRLIHMAYQYPNGDTVFYEHDVWFYRIKDGTIINITYMIDKPFHGDEMPDDDLSYVQIVDIGDYNGDGKNEMIFWCSRYNMDGYVMIFENFTRIVRFEWNYH